RQRVHALPTAFHRFAADGSDGDEAGIVHGELGTSLVLNSADRLSLRPDEITDLLWADLYRHDARRERRELHAWGSERFLHLTQDVETSLFRLRQRLLHDGEIEALDLDVHLDGRDPRACPGNLEIHVAKVVLGT